MNFSDFLKQYLPAAQAVNRRSGIPASAVLAQAYHESNTDGGLSDLAAKYNNFFGIKGKGDAGSVWLPTTEYVSGQPTAQLAEFARYTSPQAGFEGYVGVIQGGHYQDAIKAEKDPIAYVQKVAAAGYATDPHYADSVTGLIKQYNLTQYDTGLKLDPNAITGAYSYPGQDTVLGSVFGSPGDTSHQQAIDRAEATDPGTTLPYQISGAMENGLSNLVGGWVSPVLKTIVILVLVVILAVLIIQAVPSPQKTIMKGVTGA